MAVIIVFLVVSSAPITLFTEIKPYLFTTYFNVWQKVMEQPVPWSEIASYAAVPGAVQHWFFLATWYIFVRKTAQLIPPPSHQGNVSPMDLQKNPGTRLRLHNA